MRTHTVTRVIVLALGSTACALAAGLVALWVNGITLPPTDLAYGMTVLQSLRDPFVRGVWLSLTFAAAVPGFAVALWALWRVQLAKAFPLIFLASTLSAGATARYLPPLSPVTALLSATAVMVWCRYHSQWRSH